MTFSGRFYIRTFARTNMFPSIVKYFILSITILDTRADLGGFCRLSSGEKGECVLLYQCPNAMRLLRQNLQPETCGFQGSEALVCCSVEPSPLAQANEILTSGKSQQRIPRHVLPDLIRDIEVIKCTLENGHHPPGISIARCNENEAFYPFQQGIISATGPPGRRDSCQLSNDEYGECLPISVCRRRTRLFRHHNIPPVFCDQRRHEPVVCCGVYNGEGPTEQNVAPLENLERHPCRFPSNEIGECVPLGECLNADGLQRGLPPVPCGPPSPQPLVCCPRARDRPFPRTPGGNTLSDIPDIPEHMQSHTNIPPPIESATPQIETTFTERPITRAPQVQVTPKIEDTSSTVTPYLLTNEVTTKTAEADQNDPCQLSSGESGICLFVYQCPSALKLAQQRQLPDFCGRQRQGSETLVCCKRNSTDGDLNPQQRAILDSTRISQQKCTEYYEEVEKFTESKILNKPFVVGGVDSLEKEFPHVDDSLIISPTFNKGHIFVIGGVDSLAKEFPHMAALGYGTVQDVQWLCGGSLISPNFVLTAAHCTNPQDIGPVKFVRMGLLNLKVLTNFYQDFVVTQIYRHPDYKPPVQYNDIALLKLNKDAEFTDYVKPACLYSSKEVPNQKPIATGWGKTQFNGEASDVLQKVDLNFFSNEKCREAFATVTKIRLPNGILDDSQVCAGGVNAEKDTCQGDSGGPLQCKLELGKNKPFYIIGITSFGKACGLPNVPAVYTRVSKYVPWIEQIVWPQG